VQNLERATEFYAGTLGLEQIGHGQWPEFQLGENVSLYLLDLSNIGREWQGPHAASIALRVPDVAEARRELEEKGVAFDAETIDSGVCHMALFRDPDGNSLMLHRRYAPQE
jgi:catechol 2,3-dioxygenase-like lactoylglutathione lyase family enzyme